MYLAIEMKTHQINASYNYTAWKNKHFYLSRSSNARIHRNITLKISKCTNIIKNMWELQGRVGSELSACATYIYLYIYIIYMLQKETKNPILFQV